jgi:hypothetical protein
MKAVEKLINEACKWEGYCEKKDASNLGDSTPQGKIVNAGRNNFTIFGKHLLDVTGAKDVYGIDYQWCDQFCDDTLVRAFGIEKAKLLLGGWSAYTPTSANYYKKMGQWHKTGPKVGDQIFFRNSERIHHTGWVIAVGTSTVRTVEGNTSAGANVVPNGGKVAIKEYSLSDPAIAGYGRPNWSIVDVGDSEAYPTWVRIGEGKDTKWYFRLEPGINAHGWRNINGHRYYFDETGLMAKEWKEINNKWYYFQPEYGKGASLAGALYVSDDTGAQRILTVK